MTEPSAQLCACAALALERSPDEVRQALVAGLTLDEHGLVDTRTPSTRRDRRWRSEPAELWERFATRELIPAAWAAADEREWRYDGGELVPGFLVDYAEMPDPSPLLFGERCCRDGRLSGNPNEPCWRCEGTQRVYFGRPSSVAACVRVAADAPRILTGVALVAQYAALVKDPIAHTIWEWHAEPVRPRLRPPQSGPVTGLVAELERLGLSLFEHRDDVARVAARSAF